MRAQYLVSAGNIFCFTVFHVQVMDLVSTYEFLMILTIESSRRLYEKYSFCCAHTEIVLIGSFLSIGLPEYSSEFQPPLPYLRSALATLPYCVWAYSPHFVMQTFSVYLIAVNACCASIRMEFNSYFGSCNSDLATANSRQSQQQLLVNSSGLCLHCWQT